MPWPSNRPDTKPPADKLAAWRERFADADRAAGIETNGDFAPFDQMNDMFTRAFWDPDIRTKDTDAFFASYRMAAAPRRGDGFSIRDFALRNAAWSVSDMVTNRGAAEGRREGFQAPVECETPVAPDRLDVEDTQAFTSEIKQIAKLFGADLCGVCEIDERWHYTSRVDTRTFEPAPNDLPDGLTHVIVMAHAMDERLVAAYPSALAGASTGLEYSHEAAIVTQMTAYIRNLGYQAIGSMNDTALVIPYAVKAGLGEYGRNQMVLTPEFGPRVRFSKIFTDLPLVSDTPRDLGLAAYCHSCTKCADACPPKALPYGEPRFGGDSPSTIKGVKKWSADCEKCFGYWAKLKTDCAICMRVCPFNRDYTRPLNRLFRTIATGRLRRLALWWEGRKGPTKRLKPADWWASLAGKP